MSFREQYQKTLAPELQKTLTLSNVFAVPKVTKVVINVGTSHGLKDAKWNEVVEQTLTRITGQKPVTTRAKKSISNFKIREGMVVGYVVTLRGKRMYDFIEKLVRVALPRIRDFRGLDPKGIDRRGNLTIGLKEHLVFPEIRSDEVEKIHGLEITLVTTAATRDAGLALFKAFGFPFRA